MLGFLPESWLVKYQQHAFDKLFWLNKLDSNNELCLYRFIPFYT